MQPNNFTPSNFVDLVVCWVLWGFGTLLDKFCSVQLFLSNNLSLDILSIDYSWTDTAFRLLQASSFVLAIIVSILNIMKFAGYNFKKRKR